MYVLVRLYKNNTYTLKLSIIKKIIFFATIDYNFYFILINCMIDLIIKSFFIGLVIAIPVGPISLLCITHSLEHGFLSGFAVTLGAAFADAFYGICASGGLSLLSSFLIKNSIVIKIIGGLFLLFLGITDLLKAAKKNKTNELYKKSFIGLMIEVFFLTIANPMTILGFIAIFSSFNLHQNKELISLYEMILISGGIFLGCLIWMSGLSLFVSIIKKNISKKIIRIIKIISSSIIVGFGLYSLIEAIVCLLK